MENSLQELRDLSEQSLYFFARGIMSFDFLEPHIHGPACKQLEDFEHNTMLGVCWPRGWLKTTVYSQAYPLWRGIKDPKVRCLLTQNTHTNAVSKNRVIKETVIGNALFRALWPEILPTSSSTWKEESLCLNRPETAQPESTWEAAGAGTQVTSRHYDVIIEDDTVAPDLSDLKIEIAYPTREAINKAIGWHRLVPPLLIDPIRSQNLVVGTRWAEEDLIAWVQDNEPGFDWSVRACAEDPQGDPLDYKNGGQITYPERFNEEVLERLRVTMGPYLFACLYLNTPTRSEDMVFKLDWFKYYETFPSDCLFYTTVDPSGDPKDNKGETDPNAIITCGKSISSGQIYVVECVAEKMNPSECIDEIFRQQGKWKSVCVGIEDVSYQKTLKFWVEERMRSTDTYFPIKLIGTGNRKKTARQMGLQPPVKSGQLMFRRHHQELITQLLNITPERSLGKHDDLADALSMQLELWNATRSTREIRAEQDRLHDPLSLDAAIQEAEDRAKWTNKHNPVTDVLRPRAQKNWMPRPAGLRKGA